MQKIRCEESRRPQTSSHSTYDVEGSSMEQFPQSIFDAYGVHGDIPHGMQLGHIQYVYTSG
jgi:hypothetical protein